MQENLEHFKGRNEYGESLQTQGHSFSYEHKKNAGQYKESKRALFTLRKLLWHLPPKHHRLKKQKGDWDKPILLHCSISTVSLSL